MGQYRPNWLPNHIIQSAQVISLGFGVLGTYCVYLAIGVLTLSPGGSDSKASVYSVEDLGLIPGSGSSLEKEMATHSSILAWKMPWMKEPGRLQSMGSQRVRHY